MFVARAEDLGSRESVVAEIWPCSGGSSGGRRGWGAVCAGRAVGGFFHSLALERTGWQKWTCQKCLLDISASQRLLWSVSGWPGPKELFGRWGQGSLAVSLNIPFIPPSAWGLALSGRGKGLMCSSEHSLRMTAASGERKRIIKEMY